MPACASSSHPRRAIYGDAERVPDAPRTSSRGRCRRTGSRSSHASTSRARRPGASASTPSCSATSASTGHGSDPTWRSPGSRALSPRGGRSRSTATAASRGASRTSRDVVDATIEAMRAGRGTYNVGGGEEATIRETIDMLEELSGRTLELRHAAVARETSGARAPIRRRSAAISAGRRRRRSATASLHSGNGPLLGSARDERARGAGSRRRAGGRPSLGVVADHGPLVPAGGRAPDRRRPRRPRLGRQRRHVPRPHAPLPRAAVHDVGRRPDPEPRDEPGDGEPDHPLRGGPAPRRGGERAHARPAARQRHLEGGRLRGPGPERVAARRDHGQRASPAQGGEGGERARRVGRRRRLHLRRPEDRPAQQADRVEPGRARRTSTSGSRTPSPSSSR